MAFIENNFGPVGGLHGEDRNDNSSGVSVFSYITADTLSVVGTAGYFNELRSRVHQGDIIYMGTKQLGFATEDKLATDNEYTIVYFDSVPRPPATGNVTLNSKEINAS